MSTSAQTPIYERFDDSDITSEILSAAARLFSDHYGVWGPLAEAKLGAFAKRGQRIRMGVNTLTTQCLPTVTSARNIYIRVQIAGQLVGNVFASRWRKDHDERNVCWISQLVVHSAFRKRGLATRLLRELREPGEMESERGRGSFFGILSSYPAAVCAALRALGRGLDDVDLEMTKSYAREIMQFAPVSYVRNAVLRGSLFDNDDDDEVVVEDGVKDGAVSSAYTNFWVDHQEPGEALAAIRGQGRQWPFGELRGGCEYLVLINAAKPH